MMRSWSMETLTKRSSSTTLAHPPRVRAARIRVKKSLRLMGVRQSFPWNGQVSLAPARNLGGHLHVGVPVAEEPPRVFVDRLGGGAVEPGGLGQRLGLRQTLLSPQAQVLDHDGDVRLV